ncbi:hypothetical protein BKA62DRAFT_752821 [Auriculariales sp. MPI-PUGE-AT-0066]|nr:hypothetical protein BKA62DRAFT_752821 [Auriculariales sp. MPI-PUGE-AT-0066]
MPALPSFTRWSHGQPSCERDTLSSAEPTRSAADIFYLHPKLTDSQCRRCKALEKQFDSEKFFTHERDDSIKLDLARFMSWITEIPDIQMKHSFGKTITYSLEKTGNLENELQRDLLDVLGQHSHLSDESIRSWACKHAEACHKMISGGGDARTHRIRTTQIFALPLATGAVDAFQLVLVTLRFDQERKSDVGYFGRREYSLVTASVGATRLMVEPSPHPELTPSVGALPPLYAYGEASILAPLPLPTVWRPEDGREISRSPAGDNSSELRNDCPISPIDTDQVENAWISHYL